MAGMRNNPYVWNSGMMNKMREYVVELIAYDIM
jgi:hypothetical protein